MKVVLFVCVHNAGRSQMAQAFLNAMVTERGIAVRAESAGTEGAGSLNPVAVAVMEEIGIPMTAHYPKAITPELVASASRIIGMGCGVDSDACPVKFLMAEDWGLDDPAGQSIETVRRVRDEVKVRVELLLDEISAGVD